MKYKDMFKLLYYLKNLWKIISLTSNFNKSENIKGLFKYDILSPYINFL